MFKFIYRVYRYISKFDISEKDLSNSVELPLVSRTPGIIVVCEPEWR